MKQQIKSIYGKVLFECEVPDDVQTSGMSMRYAIEKAVEIAANLSYANLSSANLSSANLSSANLSFANLSSANLSYANLSSANLSFANLSYAYLSSANLSSAYLRSADLRYAYLSSADLRYANLSSANLSSADLRYAYLSSANLRYAYLSSANLSYAVIQEDNKLIGKRPYFSIGPIGSRADQFQAFITENGLLVSAGCFQLKTLEEFRAKLSQEHQDNNHAKEYEMAILMVEAHADIWTPK